MSFRPEKQVPDFASIRGALNTAGISAKYPALYQSINSLITTCQLNKEKDDETIVTLQKQVNDLSALVNQFFKEFGWTP